MVKELWANIDLLTYQIEALKTATSFPWVKDGSGGTDHLYTIGVYPLDGMMFTKSYMKTCRRRGPFRLFIEECVGRNKPKWGCFDEVDQPMRWYHNPECLNIEARSLAIVLLQDRLEFERSSFQKG